jgi:AsmA-like C-terminal region
MTRIRLRRCAVALCALFLLIPPLLWVAVVLIAPTDWAARHVMAALEAGTRRSVRLDRLSVRWLGGVRLTNFEIGAHSHGDDPWLKARSVELDIGFLDLLVGKLRPRTVVASGVNLRVLRRADGTLELAEVIETAEQGSDHPHAARDAAPTNVQIHGASLTIVDEPSHTRLLMQGVEGEAILEERKVSISNLRGVLNGGPCKIVGQLDRTGPEPKFEGRFQADDVVLDDGMNALRYAVPVLAGASLNLKGHLDADVSFQGRGGTGDALSRSLAGHGMIAINPIDLDGAPLIAELSKIAEISQQGRIASIHSDFVIQDRRVTTDHFTLNVGRVPITFAGWTSFDGQLDYRINLKSLTDRLPDRARRLIGELNVDVGSVASLTLRGTVNQMVVQVNGVSLDRVPIKATGLKREDREKLRVLGRQFLDQIAR